MTVRHPLSNTETARRSLRIPDHALQQVYNKKMTTRAEFCTRLNARYVPIVVSDTGGLLPSSHDYVQGILRDAAHQMCEPPNTVRARFYQTWTTALVIGNARALVSGTKVHTAFH